VLRFCGNFELIKFCHNFGETFGKTFGYISGKFRLPLPPPKKKHLWEILYSALCTFYIFVQISIIPLEILYSADLNYYVQLYFQLCASNMIRPMWYKSHIMFSQNFVKISLSRVIFFLGDETFTRKFRQKVENFRANIFRKLSREILTKVSFPQH